MRLKAGQPLWSPGPHQRPIAVLMPIVALLAALVFPVDASALQKIPASRFEPTENCGCHAEYIEQWSGTMHAQALTDPLYRTKLAQANRATRGEIGAFCETCHGPVAAMAGLLGKPEAKRPAQAREGIACDFCHQVAATRRPIADSSFIVRPDGAKRAALKEPASPYHRSTHSAFHETPEFCGTCHNVNHPGNDLVLEATYTEWKEGPYAAKGIGCQDCHMTPGPGVTNPSPGRVAPFGVERQHVYSMTFVGANTALGPKALAEERLRAAARLDLATDQVVASGSDLKVTASVTNVGAGHYLPTGSTELRRMWLEVVAVDATGREALRGRRTFGTVLADAEGRSPVEIWEATSVASDDRIAPGATATEEYSAPMPTKGPVTVTATLYYRGVPEEFAAQAGVIVPVTEMAKTTTVVYISEDQMREAGMDGPPLGRFLLPLMTVLGVMGMLALVGLASMLARRREA